MCAAKATSSTLKNLEGQGEKGKIFQFKIKLLGSDTENDPNIWRRVELNSSATFWDLHCAIQNSMGWNDNHLHCFEVKNPRNGKSVRIGKPIEKGEPWSVDETTVQGYLNTTPDMAKMLLGMMKTDVRNMHASWKAPLAKYFNSMDFQYETEYTYDFGDFWVHEVIFEGIFDPQPNKNYPVCTGGKRACPPEDCGGVGGYKDLLVNLKKTPGQRTKDEEEKIKWLMDYTGGQEFDPDYFEPESVIFVNSDGWLKYKKSNTLMGRVRAQLKNAGVEI